MPDPVATSAGQRPATLAEYLAAERPDVYLSPFLAALAGLETTAGAQAKADAALAAAIQYVNENGGGGTPDGGTVGLAVLISETEVEAKTAIGLPLVENIATALFPVSQPVQDALDLLQPLTDDIIPLNGGGTLTINRVHEDTINAARTFTVAGSPLPGQWAKWNLFATVSVVIDIPESKRIGTNTTYSQLTLPAGYHEISLYRGLTNIWWLADTTITDAAGNVTAPASASAGAIAVYADETGELLAEGTLTIPQLQDRSNHNGVQPTNTVTGLDDALAALNAAIVLLAPLNSPALEGTPTTPTASRGDSSTKIASTAFVSEAESSVQIVTEAGTSRTIGLTDAGKDLRCTSNDPVAIEFPANATTAIPVGKVGLITQAGAGKVTFTGAAGVTVLAKDGYQSTAGQNVSIGWKKVATDTVELQGDRIA